MKYVYLVLVAIILSSCQVIPVEPDPIPLQDQRLNGTFKHVGYETYILTFNGTNKAGFYHSWYNRHMPLSTRTPVDIIQNGNIIGVYEGTLEHINGRYSFDGTDLLLYPDKYYLTTRRFIKQ